MGEESPSRTQSMSQTIRGALVMILAGGQGQRLVPLTNNMAKPAVRFAGSYRMIDFTLSNCINSGLRRIHLLTQYASSSLNRHVRKGWAPLLSDELGEYIDLIPPQRVFAERWYAGTADAVFQNLMLLQDHRPEQVVLLSGDHAYQMDYSLMLHHHLRTGAALTIACMALPCEECKQFGVMNTESDGRVIDFIEKPDDPPPMPDDPDKSLINMAVYIWDTEKLAHYVSQDARRDTSHDFGNDIIPAMLEAEEAIYAYQFQSAGRTERDYWRDIGTLESYWEAHMDLVSPVPMLDMYDPTWPIYTYRPVAPPAKITGGTETACITNSIISPGSIVTGGTVNQTVLSPNVYIDNAEVQQSILMDQVQINPGARIRKAIIGEGVEVPAGMEIGFDRQKDCKRFVVTDGGITVVPSRVILEEAENNDF